MDFKVHYFSLSPSITSPSDLFLPLFAILQRKVTGSWMKVTKLAWA
jgi:hypothetical protein